MMRSVVHLDADAFFASVEQSADARLRGKPIAVGGEKRGIIASASYEARKFGIYTPMPTVMARRLCPKLILVPGDFEKYELFSRLMFSYAYDFTPDVEIGSIDEGYFDLTGVRKSALGVAGTIRDAIRQSLKLSVSEGIGTNKLISQIASKLNKPAAFEFVPPGTEAAFLCPLANKWLPGIGPKTAGQLNAAGLARIGQIAQTPPDLLSLLVGSMGPQLRKFASGIDERPIIPVHAPAKSYGEQETFAADTTDEEFLDATLRRMADKLMAKVREDRKSIRTLTVKVRYNDMDEEQAAESLQEPTDLETEVYSMISKLLRKAWRRRVSLRLVSLRLSNIYDGRFRGLLPLDTLSRQHDAQERLAQVVDALREKFGRAALLRGHDFILSVGRQSSCKTTPSPHWMRRGGQSAEPSEARRDVNVLRAGTARGPLNSTYNLAVVQRQRLGHYASRQPPDGKARQIRVSPGPELRVRVQL
ncbi:MAG TPA: DNA polymerase IV, partial [Candidatus Dormibacteraeota bacterium]|nr:DNA polymerase IV [Candidatus Dormibacteraeota bacterium]